LSIYRAGFDAAFDTAEKVDSRFHEPEALADFRTLKQLG
jgi:hypothetical protein